jgi:hypothetical protein
LCQSAPCCGASDEGGSPRPSRLDKDDLRGETHEVIKRVVVTYAIRPECRDEHVSLIEGVFAQLHAETPETVDYQVLCREDGVSFVHLSSHDTEDGSNPIPNLAAFAEFQRDIASRLTGPPQSSEATVIAEYRGRATG